MRSETKNRNSTVQRNMHITANMTQTLKNLSKNWKSKTSKFTKALVGKTINSKLYGMTEDDIDKLFEHQSKEKDRGDLKIPTKPIQEFNPHSHHDFLISVKFLQMEDYTDLFLSGLTNIVQVNNYRNYHAFEQSQIEDLTAEYKKNYLVGEVIGEGAYATVRVAIYKPKKLKIAIKTYEKSKIKEIQRKKSVRREIKILQLLNHPNIVQIYDVVQTNYHVNIAMEYLSGHSLDIYLKAQPHERISQKICKKIFIQLANALAYMHSLHVSHRDIKLQNIILDEDFCPKLIDFGFSTCIQPSLRTKIFCGTPSYMAPEVVQRKEYRGETADVWALGVLLFVSLTGIFPFKGETDQQLFKKIRQSDYPRADLGLTKLAGDLIAKMLKVNSAERINAHEIINHTWFHENRNDSSRKKRPVETSYDTSKRISTINENLNFDVYDKLKLRKNSNQIRFLQKSRKSILAETCKQNLKVQFKMPFKSPKNMELQSFRKQGDNKENIKQRYTNEKIMNGTPLKQRLMKENLKDKDSLKKKQKPVKPQPKIIQLLKVSNKKKQEKSKSNTHRN